MQSPTETSLPSLLAKASCVWLIGVSSLATQGLKGAAPTAAPQATACSLVKAADVAMLLGGPATCSPAPKGTSSVWQGADPHRKLAILTYSSQTPGEMAYRGAHQGAMNDPKAMLVDESGLGDKAFSITPAFGAAFVMLKGGRVLQLQFWTGAQGTPKDREALRTVARKAIAAF